MASPAIVPMNRRGGDTPLVPMVTGRQRSTCNVDVEEAVERLCADTGPAKLAHDPRGRAYELGVSIDYRRRSARDGERTGRMPGAPKVVWFVIPRVWLTGHVPPARAARARAGS